MQSFQSNLDFHPKLFEEFDLTDLKVFWFRFFETWNLDFTPNTISPSLSLCLYLSMWPNLRRTVKHVADFFWFIVGTCESLRWAQNVYNVTKYVDSREVNLSFQNSKHSQIHRLEDLKINAKFESHVHLLVAQLSTTKTTVVLLFYFGWNNIMCAFFHANGPPKKTWSHVIYNGWGQNVQKCHLISFHHHFWGSITRQW